MTAVSTFVNTTTHTINTAPTTITTNKPIFSPGSGCTGLCGLRWVSAALRGSFEIWLIQNLWQERHDGWLDIYPIHVENRHQLLHLFGAEQLHRTVLVTLNNNLKNPCCYKYFLPWHIPTCLERAYRNSSIRIGEVPSLNDPGWWNWT